MMEFCLYFILENNLRPPSDPPCWEPLPQTNIRSYCIEKKTPEIITQICDRARYQSRDHFPSCNWSRCSSLYYVTPSYRQTFGAGFSKSSRATRKSQIHFFLTDGTFVRAKMSGKVVLYYFNGRGKMESIRWLLAVAGVEVRATQTSSPQSLG